MPRVLFAHLRGSAFPGRLLLGFFSLGSPGVHLALLVAFATSALWPGVAAAHGTDVASWGGRIDVPVVLGVAAATYLAGWSRLRRRGRAAAPTRLLVLYLVGLAALVAALLSPLAA